MKETLKAIETMIHLQDPYTSQDIVFEEDKRSNWLNSNEKSKSSLTLPILVCGFSVHQVNNSGDQI